jgi:N-carbamoyl-L-amino-acid hydrolase
MVSIDGDRLVATMKEQAEIGGTENGGLHRLTLSDEDRRIRDWFTEQCEAIGLDVRVDEFGNMFARRDGREDRKPVLLGSHLDSQPYGGIYDGALGVVTALEYVRTLADEGITTAHPIEVVNWTNEEGSRFQPALQGSGVWAGVHDLDEQLDVTDEDGDRVGDELERIGYDGDVPAEPAEEYEAYLELHIEQGPYLEEADVSVGVVEGIVGFSWGAITFTGRADHSGPTPMHTRADALVAAADVITQIRRIPNALGPQTVGTVGFMDVQPNSINIVPQEVTMTWGFRDPSDEIVEEARERVLEEAEAAAEREGVDWEYEDRMLAESVRFADKVVDSVQQAADEVGHSNMRIFSGAGHDATHAHKVCPTGMVFAPSIEGISHSEDEYTPWEDCVRCAEVYAHAAHQLATE